MVMSETGIDDGWESMMNVVTVIQDKFSKLRSKPMVHSICDHLVTRYCNNTITGGLKHASPAGLPKDSLFNEWSAT